MGRMLRGAVAALVGAAIAATLGTGAAHAATPSCSPRALTVVHGQEATATCSDLGHGFYDVSAQAAHGYAFLDGTTVYYESDPDYAGADAFTVTYDPDDGSGDTTDIAFTVSVTNHPPVCPDEDMGSVAHGQSTVDDPPCTDPDGDVLTYVVKSQPAHGTAVGGEDLSYDAGQHIGPETFSYAASDGFAESAPATASITVTDTPPDCSGDRVSIRRDAPATLGDVCSDDDGDPLAYTFGPAAHGTVSAGPDGVRYDPTDGYLGTDAFTVKANDGIADSPVATITVDVTRDHAPVCDTEPRAVAPSTKLTFDVSCSDEDLQDDGHLVVAIAQAAGHGQAALVSQDGGEAHLTYTPTGSYTGLDAFRLSVSDGLRTADAVESMHVASTPLCEPDPLIALRPGQSRRVDIPSRCTLPPGASGALTFAITRQPAKGTLATPPLRSWIYTAGAGTDGSDSFDMTASSTAAGTSPALTQPISISGSANAAPDCEDDMGRWQAYSGRGLVLDPCSDADDDPLTYTKVSDPLHGTVTTNGSGQLVYTPAAGYTGYDTFDLTASDGHATVPGSIEFDVAPPEKPDCDAIPAIRVRPGGSQEVFLDCFDPQEDPETYHVATTPGKGTLTQDAADPGRFVYTASPTAGATTDSFAVGASNPVGDSAPVPVAVTIDPTFNRKPTCGAARTVPGGQPSDLGAVCADPDGDPITYHVTQAPAHGSATDGAHLVYTPAAGYGGPDQLTVTATDDRSATSTPAAITLSVTAPTGGGGGGGGTGGGGTTGGGTTGGGTTGGGTTGGGTTGGGTTGGGSSGGGGGGPTGGGGPPADTQPPSLTLGTVKVKLAKALKSGLALKLGASEPCTVALLATVDKKTARATGLSRTAKGAVVVATLTRAVPAGTTAITLRFTAKARKALAKARTVRLALTAAGTDAAGNRGTRPLAVTLKR